MKSGFVLNLVLCVFYNLEINAPLERPDVNWENTVQQVTENCPIIVFQGLL